MELSEQQMESIIEKNNEYIIWQLQHDKYLKKLKNKNKKKNSEEGTEEYELSEY